MATFRFSSPVRGGRSLGGKIAGSLFLLPFLGMGLFFFVLMIYSLYRGARTYTWDSADCLILESRVDDSPQAGSSEPYRFKVLYTYSVGGARYTSDRYRPGYSGSSDIGETQRLADRYPRSSRAACYVDPAKPSSAILRRPNLWFAFFLFLPLIFIAVGGGGIYVLWHPAEDPVGPRLQKAMTANPRGCMAMFFGVFFLAGAGFSIFFVRPAVQVVKAKTWQAVPCTVLSSQVRSHSGEDSTTYSVEVSYTYSFGGRAYRSNRYQFLGGSSGGYAGKERIVRRLPPLTRTTCYVNPEEPSEAVMNRDFTAEYLFGLLPLIFVAVGLGGIIFSLRGKLQT